MNYSRAQKYQNIFSNCHRILGNETWGRILEAVGEETHLHEFPELLDSHKSTIPLPDFVADLARIEWAVFQVEAEPAAPLPGVEAVMVNPTLKLVPVGWKHLPELLARETGSRPEPQPSMGIHVMIWRPTGKGRPRVREAEDADLLSLKITVEKIDPREAAAMAQGTVGVIDNALHQSVAQGILLSPPSLLQRDSSPGVASGIDLDAYQTADTFTLQWHITQACDLHCKHCYDRSRREVLSFDMAVSVLEDLRNFCREMHVKGQISFTGGNPLLYPRFMDVYAKAADRGFGAAILGNPTSVKEIKKLADIAKPAYFQISLEGLEDHNDHIRGRGHFQRSLEFLDQLRSLEIYTMVMLTLSRDNIHQVLPLAEILRGRADFFTFNRLSTVGEGARLQMADPETFATFLRQYQEAARHNPVLGYKDNLFNILRLEKGRRPFGGCTGYGCGAAFNFVALLADGEVHACRKFPSLIGNITTNQLADIYQSDLARQYRRGSVQCSECRLNPVCRGCPAITHSHGLDVFKEKDPYCFMQSAAPSPGRNGL